MRIHFTTNPVFYLYLLSFRVHQNKDIINKLQNTFEEENKHLKEEITFLRKILEKTLKTQLF